MKILIDNGHGIDTKGKRSPDGRLMEYAQNRLLAGRICRGRARGTTCSAQMGTGRGGQMDTARSAQ